MAKIRLEIMEDYHQFREAATVEELQRLYDRTVTRTHPLHPLFGVSNILNWKNQICRGCRSGLRMNDGWIEIPLTVESYLARLKIDWRIGVLVPFFCTPWARLGAFVISSTRSRHFLEKSS
jgi:hypothetical protein